MFEPNFTVKTEVEKPNLSKPLSFMRYSIETQERFNQLPVEELEKIVSEYESGAGGHILKAVSRLFASEQDKLDYELARKILEKRKR